MIYILCNSSDRLAKKTCYCELANICYSCELMLLKSRNYSRVKLTCNILFNSACAVSKMVLMECTVVDKSTKLNAFLCIPLGTKRSVSCACINSHSENITRVCTRLFLVNTKYEGNLGKQVSFNY